MTIPGFGTWPPGSSSTPPPGYDLATELRLSVANLDERATKHGEEIDGLSERLKLLEAYKDTARRYLLWALTSAASLLAHWQGEPAAKGLRELLLGLLAVLK